MKYLLILTLVILTSCASRKEGCGVERYRRSFRVERITENPLGGYTVTLRSAQYGKRFIVCCSVPDSVKVGATINI